MFVPSADVNEFDPGVRDMDAVMGRLYLLLRWSEVVSVPFPVPLFVVSVNPQPVTPLTSSSGGT